MHASVSTEVERQVARQVEQQVDDAGRLRRAQRANTASQRRPLIPYFARIARTSSIGSASTRENAPTCVVARKSEL